MIHVTASKIAEVISAAPSLIAELHGFLHATLGNACDLGDILEELPHTIAAGSPFADEAAMTEAVRRGMLQALHALTLRRLPAMGRA